MDEMQRWLMQQRDPMLAQCSENIIGKVERPEDNAAELDHVNNTSSNPPVREPHNPISSLNSPISTVNNPISTRNDSVFPTSSNKIVQTSTKGETSETVESNSKPDIRSEVLRILLADGKATLISREPKTEDQPPPIRIVKKENCENSSQMQHKTLKHLASLVEDSVNKIGWSSLKKNFFYNFL